MPPYFLWCAEILMALATSLLVWRMLSRPLLDILKRLCPDASAAGFWLRYTQVMLLLFPLLLVLVVDFLSHNSQPLDTLRLAFLATLGGLLLGLYWVGRRLSQFIAAVPFPGSRS
jgi:hypothetical protein